MKRTKVELKFKTIGGIPFTVKKGSKVERFNGGWVVSPSELPQDSIERHDATYYGLRVLEEDTEEAKKC